MLCFKGFYRNGQNVGDWDVFAIQTQPDTQYIRVMIQSFEDGGPSGSAKYFTLSGNIYMSMVMNPSTGIGIETQYDLIHNRHLL